MKKYVLGYRPKEKEKESKGRPFEPAGDIEVAYSKEAQWKMPMFYLANIECDILRGMRVHIGSHNCEFSVEELPEGEFAIVCLFHPDPAAGRS